MAKKEKVVTDPVPAPGSTQEIAPGPVLSVEDQAEVDRLATELASAEKPPAADLAQAPAQEEPLPAGSFADDAAMAVEIFTQSAIAYCPAVEKFWPTEKCKSVSVALARVFEKYNFTFARFGPEVALLVAAGPALWQTSKAIAQMMNEQAAAGSTLQQPAPAP